MKVTITTPFARLQVDLTAERAANLMEQALFASVPDADRQDAEDLVQGAVITLPDLDKKEKPPVAEVKVPTAKKAPKVTIPEQNSPDPADPEDPVSAFIEEQNTAAEFTAEEPTPENGYRGFLHIKCDECHKERSFHMKHPIKEYRCECGHTQPLHGLSKIVAKCNCGWELKYYTNQDADAFEMTCPSCREKVLVKWNFRHKRYEKTE